MSHLYIPNSSASISTPGYLDESDDEDTLPYPTPLPRSDFLTDNFEPSAYLSTLRNRHQTLEDLRGELRARSQLLNQELLDLVNGNYEEFLSLGGDLKSGDEKVEGVKVGLLGFRREIEGVRKAVQERLAEAEALLEEKRSIRKDVVLGRALLDVESQIGELEESMGVTGDNDDVDDDVEDDEEEAATGIRKLQTHAQSYLLIQQTAKRVGADHPFLVAQQPRLEALRKTLLLDLAAALRQAKASHSQDVLAIVQIYGDLDAAAESVKVLKG